MENKKIYFDFETTHTDPNKARIVEACFLFVENGEIIEKFQDKILLKEYLDQFDQEEQETLKFNKIFTQQDLNEHNKKSITIMKYIEKVMVYYLEMWRESDEKYPLGGWNNAKFDNIILNRYLSYSGYDKNLFDYHTRDIMYKYQELKERGFIKGLKLSRIHQELIKTIKENEFHNSYVDCVAVKDLDEWFQKNIIILGPDNL